MTLATNDFGMPIVDGRVGEPIKGRIGVLVEEHFDQTEFLRFNEFFPAHGYQVEYISHLWDQPSLTFRPNADDGVMKVAVRVTTEVNAVTPSRYKAIICIGAYAADRLRYQAEVVPHQQNNAPAVSFLRSALATPGVKIGTICHSLWLFCADRKLLEGRKVTCATNILCDVENAGGEIVYDLAQKQTAAVVVDRDLISGRHPGVVDLFLATFLEEIERPAGTGEAFRVVSDATPVPPVPTIIVPNQRKRRSLYNKYVNQLTVTGTVQSIDSAGASLVVKARSGDEFHAFLTNNTYFNVLRNVDDQDNNPFRNGPGVSLGDNLARLVSVGQLVIIEGMLIEDGDASRFDCRGLRVLYNSEGKLLFESAHWWITQIQHLCDQLLGGMWADGSQFDFTKYRTNVGISGTPSADSLQEIETLGRLLYGFATTYMLTGNDRYLEAARSGVAYQRQWFRNISHDGKYLVWASWKTGNVTGMGSKSGDDTGSIPAYEQIYALAGLTQFYRVTLEPEALLDIRRTLASFEHLFLDTSEAGGYFSHLDPSTMSPSAEALGINKSKKNWNSVGDHIPAYLVNLILALKPLPRRPDTEDIHRLVDHCETVLRRCASLITQKFPDPDPAVPYVRERFHQDWTPDTTYSWQQDRAVCGHNLKIAWNLTRVAFHLQDEADPAFAQQLMTLADTLGTAMATSGTDQVRGGVLDCVERRPKNGMFVDFAWWNTRDFWQQEQGILAYLILYGNTGKDEYLALARETMAYWNAFFLDHDTGGIYFRVDGNGTPVLVGSDYRNQTGHAKSGYHCYELAYLAHVYQCTYVTKKSFSLNFKPNPDSGQRSINVLPDFMRPGSLRVKRICVNGVDRESVDPDSFKIELGSEELGAHLIVELEPIG